MYEVNSFPIQILLPCFFSFITSYLTITIHNTDFPPLFLRIAYSFFVFLLHLSSHSHFLLPPYDIPLPQHYSMASIITKWLLDIYQIQFLKCYHWFGTTTKSSYFSNLIYTRIILLMNTFTTTSIFLFPSTLTFATVVFSQIHQAIFFHL